MFNLVQVDNRIDITSSGVDFRITGSYISGTSLMVANIEAVGYDWDVYLSQSGTLANVKLVALAAYNGIINCFQRYNLDNYSMPLGLFNAPKDSLGIAGTVTEIQTNTSTHTTLNPGPILSNGKYIYTYYRSNDSNPYKLSVREYDTSDGTSIVVDVVTSPYYWLGYGYETYMCVAGDRKILILDEADMDASADNYYVRMVDFNTESSSIVLTLPNYDGNKQNWPAYLVNVVDDSGGQHLIIGCTHTDTDHSPIHFGVKVYLSTNNGVSWDEYTWFRGWGDTSGFWSDHQDNFCISDNRYLCMLGSYEVDDVPDYWAYEFIVFDISTNTFTAVNYGNFPTSDWQQIQTTVEEISNHHIYIRTSEDGGSTFTLYDFDPLGLTVTDLTSSSFLMNSKDHAYNWDDSDNIYETVSTTLEVNSTRPTDIQNVSNIMDDGGIIWYMDGQYLIAMDLDGVEQANIDTSIAGSIGVMNSGSFIILYVGGETDTVTYYVVT